MHFEQFLNTLQCIVNVPSYVILFYFELSIFNLINIMQRPLLVQYKITRKPLQVSLKVQPKFQAYFAFDVRTNLVHPFTRHYFFKFNKITIKRTGNIFKLTFLHLPVRGRNRSPLIGIDIYAFTLSLTLVPTSGTRQRHPTKTKFPILKTSD